ncbi:protein of unknown function [Azospirillum baldaniorum]|uniref:Uncharacterized protein n=1 Tax=Azospirillum baldaniorum TaxID=1064539 RepID=A0A9P1JTH2_9PROT|nr:protein of unknown function [Azospirillum baldaniorum]
MRLIGFIDALRLNFHYGFRARLAVAGGGTVLRWAMPRGRSLNGPVALRAESCSQPWPAAIRFATRPCRPLEWGPPDCPPPDCPPPDWGSGCSRFWDRCAS